MFLEKKLRIILLSISAIIVNLPPYALAGGLLSKLLSPPKPDFEFVDLKDIKNFIKPELPAQTKQEVIKLALSNKDIQNQIFSSKSFEGFLDTKESGVARISWAMGWDNNITWLSYATNENDTWTIHLRSSSSIPLFECYFTIDNQGNQTSTEFQQGCKYDPKK